MLNLTHQERVVLLFIALVALSGTVINYLQKNNPQFKEFIVSNSAQEETYSNLDLNKATPEELQRLPGIGPELARRILAYRASNNGFKTSEEIKKVKGIGSAKFELIKGYISIGENSD